MKKNLLLLLITSSCFTTFSQGTIIGNTTYDVQTNNSSKNRIIVYDDGTMSSVWTGSTELLSTFSDRGTFYNHFDGTSWGVAPTTRVEDVRTGFTEMIQVEDHEVVMSHYSVTATDFNLRFFENESIGSTTWTETTGSATVTGLWPFAHCPAGTNDLYVVTANLNPPTEFHFSRSDDGGDSWTILNQVLPYLSTADGIPYVGGAAESYQIRAHGSDVYVLFGMPTSDLVLLHSADYGNPDTWERTDIIDFPYDNFDGLVQTDIDGDGVTDTLQTTDGYHELLITDDGTVHVFSGLFRIYSDGFGYINNFKSSGIWHWTTGMDSAVVINTELDWSSPDCEYSPYTGIGAYTYNYRNAAVSSSPAASWDPTTGRIYLLYTMKLEYTDLFDDPLNFSAESFRDIFGTYSDDGGVTWTRQNNLTHTAESERENFYVFVNDRVIDGKVHAVWQEDSLPGHFNEGDIIHSNNLMYEAFEEADFISPTPTADFDYTVDVFYVTFENLSTGATCYLWDFGDGTFSTLETPAHSYPGGGTFTVCLSAFNEYGPVTTCEDVYVVTAPEVAFSWSGDPSVLFTDLSTNSPDTWSWDFDDGITSTEQNPTHLYADNGLYNVCLTAGNAGGSNTACLNVGINFAVIAPVADFSYTAVGLNVAFTDISMNVPTSWSWNFGDGTALVTDQDPNHLFTTGGTYNVCLTASNAGGITTECKQVLLATGINNIADISIQVYPNPANSFVNIESTKDISSAIITCYNTEGQEIEVEKSMISNFAIQLKTQVLESGSYIIKLTIGATAGTFGLVIE